MSQMGQFQFLEILSTLTGDTGDIVHPQINNINILGGGGLLTVDGDNLTASLTINPSETIAASFVTDAGTAVPALNALNVLGGKNIGTTGVGDNLTINLDDDVLISGSYTTTNSVASSASNTFNFRKDRTSAVITTGDYLGEIHFKGHDGTGYIDASKIISVSSGTIATNRVASDLEFWTHPDSTGVSAQRMVINSTGTITVNAPDSGNAMNITGNVAMLASSADHIATELDLKKSRSGSVITSGDELGNITFQGHDGTGYVLGAAIIADTSGTIATDRIPTKLEFWTHPDSAVAATKRLTIDTTGEVTIAAPDSGTALTVGGTVLATTFDTNVAAAAVTLSGTTLQADGTDADININITAKGTGKVIINDLQLTTDLAVTEGGTGASTLTDHGVLLGHGTSAVTGIAGATGEVLIGTTGADASWSSTPTVTTIYATTFDTNVAAAAVTLSGTTLSADGTDADININITAKGTGKVIIDDLQLTTDLAVTEGGTGASTLTDHGVLLGHGTSAVTGIAGATGEVLIGNTGADASWSSTPTVTTLYATTFDTNVAAAAVTLSGTTLSADGTDADININITAKGTGKVIIDDLQLTTDLAVTEGGTGASTLTSHGVLLGQGTSAVTATAVGATGTILTGVTGNDPAWTTATYPATVAIGDVLIASAANVIGATTGAATAGYVLTANGAGTAPTFQANPGSTAIQTLAGDTGTATGTTVTIAGGTNLTSVAAASTVTLNLDSAITLTTVNANAFTTTTVATNITMSGNTIETSGTDTNVDLNFVCKGVGGLTFDGIVTGYSDSQWHLRQEEAQTTDATPTALVTIPLVEGEMLTINDVINGFQSDFSDACGAQVFMTAYRPTGGNITQVGEEIINMNSTSTASVSADVNIGTQSIVISVIGVTAETWNWVSTHQYMFTKTNA